jgi:hypothetical protein
LFFDKASNPRRYLAAGWSEPELSYTWAVDDESWVILPTVAISRDCVLSLEVFPYLYPGRLERQRLNVFVNGHLVRSASVRQRTRVFCRIPAAVFAGGQAVRMRFEHPDGARPNDLPAPRHPDNRRLSLAFHELQFVELSAEVQSLSQEIGSALRREPGDAGFCRADRGSFNRDTLKSIFVDFQSLGEDCEFGMMQRRVASAGSIGLFRFGYVNLYSVLHGLEQGFAGIDAEQDVAVMVNRDSPDLEYFGYHIKYRFGYHTGITEADMTSARLRTKQRARLAFLASRLMEDIRGGHRLLVIKRKVPIEVEEMAQLAVTVRRIGPSTLLWVGPEEFGRPAGSVERLSETLLRGYIGWIDESPMRNTDLASWSKVCVAAHRLWRGDAATGTGPAK